MKKINFLSKKAENFINNYNRSTKKTLSECYKTMSESKRNAETYCKSRMLWEAGRDFRIISYTTTKFTCGWTTKEGNLRIETKDNSYLIIMPF